MTSKPTRAQMDAFKRIWERPGPKPATSYLQFRRSIRCNTLMGCYLVYWRGMCLGIEPDGYTHS